MPDSPTSEPESDFVCGCEEWMRYDCTGGPFDGEHQGEKYCVLHFPGKEKSAIFKKILKEKCDKKDFNFRGAWFPDEVSFSNFDFSEGVKFGSATFSADADFSGATFGGDADFSEATFSADADFSEATFSADADFGSASFMVANFRSAAFAAEAYFRHAMFGPVATFNSATFSADAVFSSTTFEVDANFGWARFRGDVSFLSATFSGNVSFRSTAFAKHVTFAGTKSRPVFIDTSSLDLQFARFENSEVVSLHTLTLRPHWFVNVDPRKFDFINVDLGWRSPRVVIREELDSLKAKAVSSPNLMLAIACRQLAVNAEENNRYEEASRFRFMSMDALRRERRLGFAPWRLSWWYWLASGYGERVFRALVVLVVIWLLAGLTYNHVGFARWEPKLSSESDAAMAKRDDIGAPLKLSRALTYSAGVMTFQKPEPRPATMAAQTVVLLETVFGPLQAALLALAIRRKFMR